MKKHFRDAGWTIRPPRRIQDLQAQIKAVSAEYWRDNVGEPTVEWLSEQLHVAGSDIREAQGASGLFRPRSLDLPTSEGPGSASIGDHVVDPAEPATTRIEDLHQLTGLMKGLDSSGRELLRMRFVEELTQLEIGERIGISQMQVSRRLTKVLDRLRATLVDDAG